MPTERMREEHGVSKVRKLEVSRVRDGDQARSGLQVSLVRGVPQDAQDQRGSVRGDNSAEEKEESKEGRGRDRARNKHRRLQYLEVMDKINSGTWWPFDKVDPSLLASKRRARSVVTTTQHEEAPL
jgi:hypothetical protein